MARKNLNLGNLLVVVGMGWLGFGFWLPYATAERVYRLESRSIDITRGLVDAAKRRGRIDWKDTGVRDAILAEINERFGHVDASSSLHVRVAEVPERLQGRGFVFAGKHYLYLLTNTPREVVDGPAPIRPGDGGELKGEVVPVVPVGPDAVEVPDPVPLPEDDQLPFEGYAWPQDRVTGARSVAFVPSDGVGAFTRNLNNRYVGPRRPPMPGAGRFDIDTEKRENAYRGRDDERWIYQTSGGG